MSDEVLPSIASPCAAVVSQRAPARDEESFLLDQRDVLGFACISVGRA